MAERPKCLRCETPVSYRQVIAAGLPSKIKCGHCKATLTFDFNKFIVYPLSLIMIVAVFLAGLASANWFLDQPTFEYVRKSKFIYFTCLMGFALIFELLFAYWLLNFNNVSKSEFK